MSRIGIHGLTKMFDGKPPTTAIDDLDLEIAEGEFLVLLGPSGCGKTTTLRCLAGLERPDSGRITFGDTAVFDAATRVNQTPDRRSIGMVFQSYALWPHLTVRRNIAYPLRARRLREGLKAGWVEETAELVDCGALLDRYPAQLSGGQQQRVALARGLVARPDLVLFDEPLSNLDARLRDQVRAQIHQLHGRLGFTAVFVTHDQTEALALGDRLAIMKRGRVEQYGTPDEVFENPVSEYVADFIGMSNRLEADYLDGGWVVAGSRVVVEGLSWTPGHLAVRMRADDVEVLAPDTPARFDRIVMPAEVLSNEYGGRIMDVTLRVGETDVMARIPAGEPGGWARSLTTGDRVAIGFDPTRSRAYPIDTATTESIS